jgi:hypothetical protein
MMVTRISSLAALAVFVPAALFAGTPNAPQQSAPAKSKLVCKSFPQIGSLVARSRVCKTEQEWAANRALLRQPTGVSSCSSDGHGCSVPGK